VAEAAAAFSQPLRLPCGAVLANRLVKAAMTEGLADAHNRVTDDHLRLYRRWAANGFGLMITGNVQVDRRHMERPGNIAIDDNGGLEALQRLAAVGTADGGQFWMQINHAGRLTPAALNARPLAPSGISLPMAEAGCGSARAMTEADIHEVIARFARTAATARDCGFTGVQIHAAHGYLLSQFLSPLANVRTDDWGGALANRARLLLETVAAVRRAVGADFAISVKLNSADFQRGGFSFEESMQVAEWLDAAGIDLLEITGGNYEQMQMVGLGEAAAHTGRPVAASTAAREAYFLDFAEQLRPRVRTPLLITGGMRSARSINAALQSGACDAVGIGRPICVDPDGAVRQLLAGAIDTLPTPEFGLHLAPGALGPEVDAAAFKRIESFGLLGWFCLQLLQIGAGEEPDLEMDVMTALMRYKDNEAATAEAWARP
jgi:2,4-dienoyl-CoA reductase-like NADH-dependent reductase (Old Yellow Enzyme family)